MHFEVVSIKDKITISGPEMILHEVMETGQVRVARRAPLNAVLRYVARTMPPPLPLFPQGARWLCQKKDLLNLVVEHSPQCRTLRVSSSKKGADDYQTFRLAFPYILYVLTFYRDSFEEMKMFFRNHPLNSLDDTLYHTNLPNVRGEPGHHGSQRVCLRYRQELLEGVPLAEAVPALLSFFWNTGFNQDIANSAFERAKKLNSHFSSFEAWEAASKENPLFPLEVEWEPAGRNLPGLWAECLMLHGETDQPVASAEELADILYRLPIGY